MYSRKHMDMESYDDSENDELSYYEQDETPSDYESENYDEDDDEEKPKLLISSPEPDILGMTSLSKKSSPRPTQLLSNKTSQESPWKTQNQMRVSLRAISDKMEADRKAKEQNEIEIMTATARDTRMESERKARAEKQELEAAARLKEREIQAEKNAKIKARENLARIKAKKLEADTELKRRQDETDAVKEARAERRRARGFERKQELQMNRANQIASTPIVKTEIPIPLPEKSPSDSETDSEDEAELLALVQSKTQSITSKSERIIQEKADIKPIPPPEEWIEVKNKKQKPTKPIIKMGQESYRKEYHQKLPQSNRDTTQNGDTTQTTGGKAQTTGGKAQELQQRLTKTRFCLSLQNGVPCPHGKNCRFAHTSEELEIPPCLFGDKCNFIKNMGNGLFTNCNKKICKFLHSGESRESFYDRTGIKPPTTKTEQKPPPRLIRVIKPTVVPPATWNKQHIVQDIPKPGAEPKPPGAEPKPELPIQQPPIRDEPNDEPNDELTVSTTTTEQICKYVAQGKPCPHKKCRFSHTPVQDKPAQTIYVPESQYMVALEMAMKTGNNIRIEIAK